MKKVLALVLALVMVMVCFTAALADEESEHVITITNTDQNVAHTYEAYQVFVGKLDAEQTKLSDVAWGSGVNGAALLTALKADTTYGSYFTDCASAADVAAVLSANPFTSNSAAIDAIASIVSANLNASNKVAFTEDGKTYTATVTGDGYYFIKDTTTTLSGETGSDTLSKYLLAVAKDVEIVAKDTHLTPDKEIVEDSERVKTGSAAIGDTVTFEVKIKVPDTRKYIDHFVFVMNDTLPTGMTFTGVTSVKVGEDDVPHTVTVAEANSSSTYTEYTVPENPATAAGGQKVKIVFNGFKAFAETEGKNYIGQDLIITYTAVVNTSADFTPTGNENEVEFTYSNDPNHDYDGDEPGSGEPTGTTPESKTKTLLINIEILKTGDNGAVAALSGAEFEITSDDYNVTLVSGEKFEETGYEAVTGETVQTGTYYQLKDGSYTTTAPTDATASSYNSTTKTYVKVTYSNSVVTPTGTTKKVTAITGEDGKIVLKGLKPGTYTVKETKAPSGYNLDPTEYKLVVEWDSTNKTFVKGDTSSASFSAIDSTGTFKITIDDKSGTVLPGTGGIGTTIFYILGGLLVIGAAVILIARRKANN